MDKFAIYFLLAFLVNFIATPIFARVSLALGIIDHPSEKRFHLTSMPMLGGLSMTLSFLAVMLYLDGGSYFREYWTLFAAASFMMAAGLFDDIKGINPGAKLLLQAAASALIIAGGHILSPTGVYPVDVALTAVWIIGIINALNLIDNIDGLSSGTAAICSCFFGLFALLVGKPGVALTAMVFSGVCMGFLFHNFHPATLFLGDAGSMFVGTMLAGMGVLVAQPQNTVHFWAIGVVLGLLIFDTGLVTVMRVANGLKITEGGKDHTSHRLCNMGLSIQGAVTTLFAADFLFGAAAILMLKVPRTQAFLIPLVLFLIGATCWFLLKDTYDYKQNKV
jgi:UDP-GlcNAc:undecaprenyl-phosphate GlcNAc-1-phosphate transferase